MAGREINEKLLKFVEIPDAEIEEMMPDWLEAMDALGLTDEKVRYALEDYIPNNWDVQYRGVRLMLGAWLREMLAVCRTKKLKAEGKKIIYGILPAVVTPYAAFKRAGGDNVHTSFPDLMLVKCLNGIFHEAGPLITKAEDMGFSYGCRHCPLNKMRLAAYGCGIIASPDIIWSWGFNCDEGPKTDELIQAMIGEEWKYVVSRIPHDTLFGQEDDEYERVLYLSKVIKDDIDAISAATGIYPSEEDFKGAIADGNRYLFKIGQLVNLVCNSDPVPLGGNAVTNFEDGVSIPLNYGYKYLEEALDVMIKELRAVVKKGEGVLPKGAPKVGSYFVPYCIPWIDRVFRDNGVATTFSQVLTPSKSQMKASQYTDDPYMAIAETWLKMPLGQNMGYEAESMIEKVKENHPDGMLMGFFDFDRWLGAHQKMCADLVEEATGVPHYYIESDFWDDREYSEEALRTRIESICQILHMRKGGI